MTDHKLELERACLLLECALPFFEAEARAEKKQNTNGSGLREITCQERLKAVQEMCEAHAPQW